MRVSILGIPPLQVCTYEIMFRIYYILTVIYLIHSQSATGRLPCRRFSRHVKEPWVYVEVGTTGKIDRPFLAHNSV